jgi:spore coat protein CotH
MALAVVFTCLLTSGSLSFISKNSNSTVSYADLFDTSYVHSINIEVDDDAWQEMLDNATAEEYISCDVTIDGTKVKNVAIRPKGNTSLSNVSSLDSQRYSFKINFDKYDEDGNYKGLDKLCLNNIIQDNTYMKDYFSYRMMNEAGAEAPLCSYIYITVNDEDWGLYLAVEGIEEAFAQRTYGDDYGQLYKPETMAMGGGMGKKDGKDGGGEPPEMGGGPGGMPNGEQPQGEAPEQGEMPNGEQPQGEAPEQGEMPNGEQPQGEAPEQGDMPQGEAPEQGEMPNGEQPQGEQPNENSENSDKSEKTDGEHKDMGGGGPMGNNTTVALVYQGDDIDDYSAIFDYSIFNPDKSDKKRLIKSIKKLNEGEDLDEVVNVDEVLRYFAAHNFTVNFDSYTGNMMHNYYLHEKDGQMSMIAWDYNLAFGGFGGGMGGGPGGDKDGGHGGAPGDNSSDSATEYVNYPIDTPLSGASMDERPMLGKLLENPEYMEQYHEVFDEFISNYIESGDFEDEYNRVYNMIVKYVKKDPTKFCTLDEFVTGSETLKQFITLRAESVRGQLDGTIPSTTDGQAEDSSSLIDASSITISDMGSMNAGGGPGGGNGGGPGGDMFDLDKLSEMTGIDKSELEGKSQDEIRSLIEEKINNGELNMSPRGDSVLNTKLDEEERLALFGGTILLLIGAIAFASWFKRRG